MAKNNYDNSPKFRVNFQIKADQVNLVDEENHMLGKFSKRTALEIAESKGLDLVEINSNNYPPIAKICDYSKLMYEQKKKAKLQKKNVQKLHTIQIHLGIEENDRNHKFKQIRKFLEDGDLVKFVVILVGREMQYKNQAFSFVNDCIAEFLDIAQIDNTPKLNGKNIEVMLKKKSEKTK